MSSYSCFIQVNNRDEILTLLNFCVIIAQNKYFVQLRGTRFTVIAYIISVLLHLVNRNYCTKVLGIILITLHYHQFLCIS